MMRSVAALAGVAATSVGQTATITMEATQSFVNAGGSVDIVVSISGELGVFGFGMDIENALGVDVFTGAEIVGGDTGQNDDFSNPATFVDNVLLSNGERGEVLPAPFTTGDNLSVGLTVNPFNVLGSLVPDLTTGGVNTLMFTFTVRVLDNFIGNVNIGTADSNLLAGGLVTYADETDATGSVWFSADYETVIVNEASFFVPTPGSAAILGLAGVVAARRRR